MTVTSGFVGAAPGIMAWLRKKGAAADGAFDTAFDTSADAFLTDHALHGFDPFVWDAVLLGFPLSNLAPAGNGAGSVVSQVPAAAAEGDDYAGDPSTTGVVAVNGSAAGTLEIAGDRDWFAVTLEAGSEYTIGLHGAPSGAGTLVDPYLRLMNGAGTAQLAFDDDGGLGTESRIAFTPSADGVYFVAAGAYNDSGAGTYEASVSAVLPGAIEGRLFNDANQNGQRDAGEAAIAGWTVFLDENANAQPDAGEPTDVSDASGYYNFANLTAGLYGVRVDAPAGYAFTGAGEAGGLGVAAGGGADMALTGRDVSLRSLGWRDGEVDHISPGGPSIATVQSSNLIDLDAFVADARFSGIRGAGQTVVILDTGIDLNHPFFGPDANADGVSDRIVFTHDYSGSPNGADDVNGHGSNVSSIALSSNATFGGMAPAANIIHLKVLDDSGSGQGVWMEQALQWVAANAATYNIASVNLSLGFGDNSSSSVVDFASDEFAALAAQGVIVVSAAGNSFFDFETQGVAYPGSDANSMAVGAVYDANIGGVGYASGAQAFTTGPDRIAPFSQRDTDQTEIFAPGAAITGAGPNGGVVTYHGTSQAAPHITGIAALMQQLAAQELGRRLTPNEFSWLINRSGVPIVDGDDEDDNVANTGATFMRVDVLAMAEAVLAVEQNPLQVVRVESGATAVADFGFEAGAPVLNVTRSTVHASLFAAEAAANAGDVIETTPGYALASETVVVDVNNLTFRLHDAVNAPRFVFSGAVNRLTLAGNGAGNVDGGAASDTIVGNGGPNTLDGRGGTNTMSGGAGNDRYLVRAAGDIIVELPGQGADWAFAAVSYALTAGAHVENLGTTSNAGTAAINLTGNALAQAITGNDGNNWLDSFTGAADTLVGRFGNDTYLARNAGDKIVELVGQGSDWAFAAVSYALTAGAHVENLSTTSNVGTAALNLTGNALVQAITGNDGDNRLDSFTGAADTLAGRSGNDTYLVRNAGDKIVEGAGQGGDWVYAAVNYALTAGAQVENLSTTSHVGTAALKLTGNALAQAIYGNDGNNWLDSFTGAADTLVGRSGDDSYLVRNAGDTIVELAGQGSDWAFAAVSYALTAGAAVENLSTTSHAGLAAINLTGNALAQVVWGNDGANVLNGGAGNDTLSGRGGADIFLFNTALNGATNVDTIVGYNVAQDTIHLENAIFTGLAAGALAAGAFNAGAAATDSDDRVIYNSATGALIFDANGSASGGATQFATLSPSLAMSATEFFVV